MNGVLRSVEKDDLSTIRDWRNHFDIKQYMFSQHEVKETEHITWFNELKNNCLKTISVYEEDTKIKGFMQLQKKSQESNVYEWGFYISPNAVRGTGTKMALLALKKVFVEMQGEKVFGEVLNFNEPSIKLHKKLGFYQEGVLRRQHLLNNRYYDVHCFGLLKAEWLNMTENKL